MRSGICPRGTLAALWIQTNSAVEIYPDLLLFMSGRPPTPGAAIPYSGLNIEIRGCFVTKVTGGPKTAIQYILSPQSSDKQIGLGEGASIGATSSWIDAMILVRENISSTGAKTPQNVGRTRCMSYFEQGVAAQHQSTLDYLLGARSSASW